MSDDTCENSCVLPVRFPRRPGENPPAAHGADCPCSAPEARISSDNRPALPHFNYRIGAYGTIREWLLHQINQTPNLKNWTHRAPDDPAIALLEGASILGDILTFYQETYANEAFLRTAQWRESISDLVRLLGYRLSPAVGGKATFAFELKKDEPVVIPQGFPLKATLKEIAEPAQFETKEAVTAYPWLNRFNLFKPLEEGAITPSTTEFYITFPEQLLTPIDLKVGDRLLVGDPDLSAIFGGGSLPNAEIVIVDSITELHGLKTYKIKGNLKRTANAGALYAFRLGRTFHHFGHNGPLQIRDSSKPVTSISKTTAETGSTPAKIESSSTVPYLNVPFTRPIKTASGVFSNPAVSPSISDNEFPLDIEVQDIPSHAPIIIQARMAYPGQTDVSKFSDFKTLVRSINRIDPATMTWGGITATISKINLSDPIPDSIGTGDIDLAVATADAVEASRIADADAYDASNEAEDAREAAGIAKAAAAAAAVAAAAADADVQEKIAEAASAAAKAATLAVAAAIAASVLKDDATDAATQAALDAANAALTAAGDAKSKTKTAADYVDYAVAAASSADSTATAKFAVTAGVAASLLAADPFLDAAVVLDGVVYGYVHAAKTAADTAKTKADPAKDAASIANDKVTEAELLAVVARDAAKADADAKARYIAAKAAADLAAGAADLAAGAVVTAKANAAFAHSEATRLAIAAEDALAAAEIAEADAAIALEIAAIMREIIVTRMYIGDALLHEVTSPLFTLKRAKTETPRTLSNILNFYGTADEVKTLKGRRILLEKTGEESRLLAVADVNSESASGAESIPQLHEITLSDKIPYADFPNRNPIVTVFGNLVDADEGKTLPEAVLGSGDATQVFQNFILPKAPLTYHIVPKNTPCETPEIAIYVDGQEWTRVDSFFGRGEQERIYIIREDANGNSWVQFGDGKTGARLAGGNNNVTAGYRRGAGAFGSLKEDTKVQAMARLKNLDKVQMPGIVTGGAPPEDGENARIAAPGKVQSLGRIVSLRDFEAEAVAIPGVSCAGAAWQLDDNIPAVVVTVLMETGRGAEFSAVRDALRNYNTLRGAGRNSIIVHEGKRLYVTASIHYALVPGFRADIVEPEIRRALGVNFARSAAKEARAGLFSLRQRKFGGREYSSTIWGVVQNVPGVLWAEPKAFTGLTDSDDPTEIALPLTPTLEPIVGCDAGHILSLYDGHLFLIAVKAEAS
jgi:hypothetical protein